MNNKIYVAGKTGLVGKAVWNLIPENNRSIDGDNYKFDYTKKDLVIKQFTKLDPKPDTVIFAAGLVGGIQFNIDHPVDMITRNLKMFSNFVQEAYSNGVKRLIYLGSSCMYPKDCPQPMSEASLMTGPLEPTNKYYAMAKLACMEICNAYREQYGVEYFTIIPPNIYGVPRDDESKYHVVEGLMKKFHDAKVNSVKKIIIMGCSDTRRELMYNKSLASYLFDAAISSWSYLEQYLVNGTINVSEGYDVSIYELADYIREATGARSVSIRFDNDASKIGMKQKLLKRSEYSELRGDGSVIDLLYNLKEMYSEWYDSPGS